LDGLLGMNILILHRLPRADKAVVLDVNYFASRVGTLGGLGTRRGALENTLNTVHGESRRYGARNAGLVVESVLGVRRQRIESSVLGWSHSRPVC